MNRTKRYWRDISRALTNGHTKREAAKQFGLSREDIVQEQYRISQQQANYMELAHKNEEEREAQLRKNAWLRRCDS